MYAGGRRERRQAGTEHASQDVRTRRADEHSRSARAAAAIHRRVRDMPCYYAPGAGAVKCCDDRVRVCVCLCVCLSLELHVRSSPNYLCMLSTAVARSHGRPHIGANGVS